MLPADRSIIEKAAVPIAKQFQTHRLAIVLGVQFRMATSCIEHRRQQKTHIRSGTVLQLQARFPTPRYAARRNPER
jgi:hypothetical protein